MGKKSSPPTPLKTGIRSNCSIKSKLYNGKRKSLHKFGGDLRRALHQAVSCLGRGLLLLSQAPDRTKPLPKTSLHIVPKWNGASRKRFNAFTIYKKREQNKTKNPILQSSLVSSTYLPSKEQSVPVEWGGGASCIYLTAL